MSVTSVSDAGTSGVERDHPPAGVLRRLRRLDHRLRDAVAAAEATDTHPGDPFRGQHISAEDAVRLTGERTAAGPEPASFPEDPAEDFPGLAFLRRRYTLTAFDLDVLMLAVAPEVDLKYQRVYAYLQDDVTQRHPTVGLALGLFCATPEEKLDRRIHFSADGPLLRHRLLELSGDPRLPLPARRLVPDEQIVDVLLGVPALDRRLASWCTTTTPPRPAAAPPWSDENLHEIVALAAAADTYRVYFRGGAGSGRSATAAWAAGRRGVPLLSADLRKAPRTEEAFAEAAAVLVREAGLFGAALHLRHWEAVAETPRRELLLEALAPVPGLVMLSGSAAWVTGGSRLPVRVAELPIPDVRGRSACWLVSLAAQGQIAAAEEIDGLAAAYRLSPGQIATAAAQACAGVETVSPAALRAEARAQTGHSLSTLARRTTPGARWDELVLPADTGAQLRELCDRAASRARVIDDWGFGRKLPTGTGTTALFLGPPGTGKTFAAEIVAGELGLDLYRIDLAGVVSKYIGETEKNLDRIFTAAADADGVLFFDEAEALFGKRSEVKDAHDRYANIEVAYLLQKMEEFEGVTILATNLKDNLDEAFLRRMAFSVHFPAPDRDSRRRIWAGIWPATTPLAPDLDLDSLAEKFALTGGNIKNIALAAAFTAAADGGTVTNRHLRHAVRREFQKLGLQLTDDRLPIGDAR